MSLNLFDLPSIDYRYKAKRDVPYRPAFTGIDPITFSVAPSEDFVDLSQSRLVVEVRLNHPHTGYTGIEVGRAISNATDTRNMTIVNNFGHSIFKQMTLKLNGALMTKDTNQYHHKAMLETLINRSKDEGDSLLRPQGWINGALNVPATIATDQADTDNIRQQDESDGYKVLETLTKTVAGKRWQTFVIKPHLAPFRSGKALVPGVGIELELYLNPNTIYLYGTLNKGNLTDKKYPYITQDDIKVTLMLRKYTLNSSVFLELKKKRDKEHKIVKYPVVRTDLRTYVIPTGNTSWEEDNVFLVRLPDRVVVALMRTSNFNGAIDRYPFAYERLNVSSIRQIVNGEDYPYKPLELSNTAGQKGSTDLLGYDRLLTALNSEQDELPIIQPEDWGEGKSCTLFVFNNVPNDRPNASAHRNPPQTGNVRLEIKFA